MIWNKKKKSKEEVRKDFLEKLNIEKEMTEGQKKKILAVITYLTDGLLIFDRDGILSFINPRAEELLDVESKEVLGRQILELNIFPRFQLLVSLVGGGIKEFPKKELQIKENFILEVSATSMIVGKEKIGSSVILHDVSQQKSIERMKTEFVTLAAHQLRTPASIVKWTIQMLLDGDLGEMTKEQKEAIEKIRKTNEKMIRLVNDLLNVAEIEEGRYLSKLVLSDIEEIIQSVIEIYKETIKQKKLEFEFQKSEKRLPKVMLDKEKITIAVKNLIDNAVRYTSIGGRIRISTEIKEREGEIEVQIQDTGLAIPTDQQNKVFTNFFRGTNIMKVETEGTGLGLFITKNIIESHKGKIGFISEEGKGSTFYFTIPIKERFSEFLNKEFY